MPRGPSIATTILLLLLLATASAAEAPAAAASGLMIDRPSHWVDPFIGTGGHGHTYPGATLPFAMVQLSPDTRLTGWDGCSGYHYDDTVVYGFSHTHLSGTGVSDYGDILFMPSTGRPKWNNGADKGPDSGYASRFSKENECASAGYYRTTLDDTKIEVELTATTRVGIHRYNFPKHELAHVIVDLTHRDEVLDSSLRVVSDTEIEGYRRSRAWAQDQVIYFVARFSRPFDAARINDNGRTSSGPEAEGTRIKAALFFGSAGGELLVRVGISAVDIEGARRNLEVETPHQNFDTYREAAAQQWDQALGRIQIKGATEAQRRIFTTALYHSLIAPNTFSDVDGRYRGMDGKVHQTQGDTQYTVFSLWDTFRATHPLLTIIEPDRAQQFVRTFLRQFDEGGRLPVWELAANETDCMIGYHSVSVIADTYMKGLRDFDAQKALRAMIDSADRDHFGLDDYRDHGFISANRESESVSKSLEYAYDDWCIARMAEAMGHPDIAARFYDRSQAWRHLLDPQSLHMRARTNGQWLTPFDPRRVDFNYTEANAWQYRFFVPHDIESLIEAMGGDDAFVARLDSLFTADEQTTGRTQADITGLIGQYAHGNEPSHHIAWLYHYAGRPDRSRDRVASILNRLYSDQPDGLAGNEDCGQMSSWYVLSSLGLYPVAPGSNEYALTAPLFDEISLKVGPTEKFRVRKIGQGAHVQSATLNGRSLTRSVLTHAQLLAGGQLVFRMGAAASPTWGRAPTRRPHSSVPTSPILRAPYATAKSDNFRDELEVRLESEPGSRLFYRETGATRWQPYSRSLTLTKTTDLEFVARQGDRRSPVVRSSFHQIPHDWTVEVASVPNSQYTAGGAMALLDGLRGDTNWRTGAWQGYQDQDFVATVDLGRVRTLKSVGAGFLQDARSWIWMPRRLVIEASVDGQRFQEIARIDHDVADDEYGIFRRDLTAHVADREARYLRFRAINYGRIPAWHPGTGGEAFVFVDEILITEATPKAAPESSH